MSVAREMVELQSLFIKVPATLFKSPFSTVPIPFYPNSLPLLQFPPFHPSVNTFFLLQFSFSLLFQAPYSLIPALSLPISLRFWEWGCPNHGDVHITVTPSVSTLSFLSVYLSISHLPLIFILLFILLFSRLPPRPLPHLLVYFLGTDMVATVQGF